MIKSSRRVQSSKPSAATPAVPTSASARSFDLSIENDQIVITREDRQYRIRGLEQNLSPLRLNVRILASRDDLVYLDTIDLTKARARNQFVRAVSSELYRDEDLIKKDMGQILLALEEIQGERMEAAKRPASPLELMTEARREAALKWLRDPKLIQKIQDDFKSCGVIGETTNALVGYLACVSRHLAKPLAIVIQSSSAAGKTSLLDAILAMMPPESLLRYSAMSAQSLFYMPREKLRHAILAIAEDQGLSHGHRQSHGGQASYALKLLQSEGELRHVCVGKNAAGKMAAEEYLVEGPIQLFLTTTATTLDEELLNRCLVLTVDESREQTRAIQARQRHAQTRDGFLQARQAERIRSLHHDAQRLLRPHLRIFNPFAAELTFTDERTRLRRDHAKYLTLIQAITLLHQYQRVIHTDTIDGETLEYLEVTREDIQLANRLAAEILGKTLDELSPHTRKFLKALHDYVTERCVEDKIARAKLRFTRKELRDAMGWSDFQIRDHLAKLVELEYVLVHRGCRGRQFVYELLYDGQGTQGEPFVLGLTFNS